MLPTKFGFIWPSGFRGEDLLDIDQSDIDQSETRYDYNLTIMESPKLATDNRFRK